MPILNMIYWATWWGGWWWDMSNWTEAQSVSISSYFNMWSWWCAFNPDGTKVYISWYDGSTKVKQFSLSTPYDLTTMSLDKSIPIAAEDIFLNSDWTVLYTVWTNDNSAKIYKNELATPRDIGSYTTTTYNLWLFGSRSFWMSDDGTRVYIGSKSAGIAWYTLSTPYDLSTATQTSVTSSVNAIGFWIKPDWTMIFCDQWEWYNTIIYWELSTPRDLSTLTNTLPAPIHWANEASWKWFNEDWTLALFVWWWNNTNYITKYTL